MQRHVFHHSQHRRPRLLKHLHSPHDVGKSHVLRRGDNHSTVEFESTRKRQLHVAGARRQVEYEVVQLSPCRFFYELLERARQHRAAPGQGVALTHEQAHRNQLHTVAFHRHKTPLLIATRAVFVTHAHDQVLAGAINISVEQAYTLATRRQGQGKVGRHRRLAHPAFSARDRHYVGNPGYALRAVGFGRASAVRMSVLATLLIALGRGSALLSPLNHEVENRQSFDPFEHPLNVGNYAPDDLFVAGNYRQSNLQPLVVKVYFLDHAEGHYIASKPRVFYPGQLLAHVVCCHFIALSPFRGVPGETQTPHQLPLKTSKGMVSDSPSRPAESSQCGLQADTRRRAANNCSCHLDACLESGLTSLAGAAPLSGYTTMRSVRIHRSFFHRAGFCKAVTSLLLAAAVLLLPAAMGHAQLSDELTQCRNKAGFATTEYMVSTLNARQACRRDVVRGQLPAETDCLAVADEPTGDESTDNRLVQARKFFGKRIDRSCTGMSLLALGWPGFCTGFDSLAYTALDHQQCIIVAVDQYIANMLRVEYPALDLELSRGQKACQDLLAHKAADMVTNEFRSRDRCLSKQERGQVPASAECRAEEELDATATGHPGTDENLRVAHNKLLRQLPGNCRAIDLSELGFPNECVNSQAPVFSLAALVDCLFETHHDPVFQIIDLIHPDTSPCGNGLIEIGERCDDGDRAHEIGESCRNNCAAVLCGDPDDSRGAVSVIDALFTLRVAVGLDSCALEVCDVDSNGRVSATDSLLLLQAAVGLDVEIECPRLSITCGNGTLDALEQCDDGDTEWDSGELCDHSCQLVACGDPNDSGTVTALDSSYILRSSVGLESCDLEVCDTDSSGGVASTDALMVLKAAVGLPVTLNCPF